MALRAAGTTLQIAGVGITEVKEVTLPSQTADTIDVTSLSVTGRSRQFIAGFIDRGEFTFTVFWNNSQGHQNFFSALDDGLPRNIVLTFPAELGYTVSASVIFTGISSSVTVDDAVTLELTAKVTGDVTTATTQSAQLTGLTVVGTGGALTPALSGNYYFTFSGLTGTSVVITPTLATLQNGKVFQNGVYLQDFGSGQAITINMSSIGSREIMLTYNEAGAMQRIYRIILVKIS